jgi:hypothetical protein
MRDNDGFGNCVAATVALPQQNDPIMNRDATVASQPGKGISMQAALRLITEVQPGGKIEVIDAQLPDGAPVEVIVLLPLH